MSLNISTRIATSQGISVENAYGRVGVQDSFSGDNLSAIVNLYASEDAFLQGAQQLSTQLVTSNRKPYDRNVESVDILDLAHDQIIALLADQGVVATKDLTF